MKTQIVFRAQGQRENTETCGWQTNVCSIVLHPLPWPLTCQTLQIVSYDSHSLRADIGSILLLSPYSLSLFQLPSIPLIPLSICYFAVSLHKMCRIPWTRAIRRAGYRRFGQRKWWRRRHRCHVSVAINFPPLPLHTAHSFVHCRRHQYCSHSPSGIRLILSLESLL